MKRFVMAFLLVMAVMALAAASFALGPEGVPRITAGELKDRLDRGEKIAVLDVRSRPSYNASKVKIKGAVRIALDELEGRAGELPMNREIAAYCT